MKTEPGILVRLRFRLEQILFLTVLGCVRFLPERLRSGLGLVLGRIAFYLDRGHRRVALDNLRRVFPERSERDRRSLARRSFEEFGAVAVEAIGSSGLDPRILRRRFEVEGRQHLETAEAAGRGVLLITAHLGNWEALGRYMALSGKPIAFVARPLDNPFVEPLFREIRERFGNVSIPKRSAARGMIRALRKKGRVVILIDQRVHPDEGKAYAFLGHPAFTTPLPARLSLRTGAPVVPFFAIPGEDRRRCRIEFRPPIFPADRPADSKAAVDDLTERYLATIEEIIREHPHLWLWAHRRWRWDSGDSSDRRGTRRAEAAADGRES